VGLEAQWLIPLIGENQTWRSIGNCACLHLYLLKNIGIGFEVVDGGAGVARCIGK